MQNNIPIVATVILTCNQKDYTLNCLKSLNSSTYPSITIVVVDNNSNDGSELAIRTAFPDIYYIRNDFNAGVAGGRNIGIQFLEKAIVYNYILILDNDTLVEENFLQPMVDALEQDVSLGVVSPKIYLMDEEKILDQAGGSVVNFYTGSTAKRGFGEYDTGQYDKKHTQDCLPSGACSLSRRSALCACSGLDEIFNPYGFEDLDYSLRIKKAGYRVAYISESIVYHKGNKTGFNKYTKEYASIKGKHLRTFMTRHASPLQMICFNLLLPLLGLKSLLREAKNGNIGAVIKLFQAYIRRK